MIHMAQMFHELALLPLLSQSSHLVESLFVNPHNVEQLASFLHDSAVIDKEEGTIKFGTTTKYEKLLEVPIGQSCPVDIIVITVGLVKSHYNDVSEFEIAIPRVGISNDKGEEYLFVLNSVLMYDVWPPCTLLYGTSRTERVSVDTKFPATFKLIFDPKNKYASCESAQEGGYQNTGYFWESMDVSGNLYLHVERDAGNYEYLFHNFLVELYSSQCSKIQRKYVY